MKPSTHPGGRLDEAFRLHRAELVRVAAFILGDRGAAEDVVQDVFVRVHERTDLTDGDPQYYLRAAVINGCRTTLRRWRLIRRHAEQQGQQSACPPLTTEAALLDEDRRRVLKALATLPGGAGKCSCSVFTWKCPRRKSPTRSGSAPGPSSRRPRGASRRWPGN
jgi:Sigma-70 region 2